MGAKVLINSDPDHGMPWAVEYYSRQLTHRTGASTHTKRDKFVDFFPFSLHNVLDGIVRNCQPGDDLILVTHGAPHKLGIYRSSAGRAWLTRDFLKLMEYLDPKAQQLMGLDDARWRTFADWLIKIQALRLNHVMIQACRIGQDAEFLKLFGKLLGCKSISAPRLRTAYCNTEVYVTSTDAQRQLFLKEYPLAFEIPTLNRGKLTLASVELGPSKYDAVMLTDSWETLGSFLGQNFPSFPKMVSMSSGPKTSLSAILRSLKVATVLPLHGFVVPSASHKYYFPNDPRYSAAINFATLNPYA